MTVEITETQAASARRLNIIYLSGDFRPFGEDEEVVEMWCFQMKSELQELVTGKNELVIHGE